MRARVQKFFVEPSFLPWLFVIHALVWTLAPSIMAPNIPLDVIEGYAWGHAGQLGFYKHPPLQAWILETFALITNRASWAGFLASQLCIITTLWAVWHLARHIVTEKKAIIATLLLEGIAYYHFTSVEFNPNVLQMPFWALAYLSFYRSLKFEKTKDWLLLALWGALGFWAKYSMMILLGVFGLFLIVHKPARRRLSTKGPWMAVLLFLVLTAPHLYWLWQSDFLPFTYVQERMEGGKEIADRLMHLIGFTGAQLLTLSGAVLLWLFTSWESLKKPPKAHHLSKQDKIFIDVMLWAPFVAVLAFIVLAGGRPRDMWGMYLWSLFGLWLVTRLPFEVKLTKNFKRSIGAIFIILPCLYGLTLHVAPYIDKRPLRVNFPGKALSQEITRAWEKQNAAPLSYVVGDGWLAGNVAFYAEGSTINRPQIFIQANKKYSPWINEADLREQGAVLIWCKNRCLAEDGAKSIPSYLKERFPEAEIQKPLTLSQQTNAKIEPVIVGWAIVKPSGLK